MAETGTHAPAFLERLPIDLLLTDKRLPDLTGLALLQDVRARRLGITRVTLRAKIRRYGLA